jgi:hypothetical protein
MGHVMVPCPEEHIEELRVELLRLTLGLGGWSNETAEALLDSLEGDDERLVLAVARAAAEYDRLPYEAAAAHLNTDVGSVLQRMTQINVRCARAGWPMPLLTDTDFGDPQGPGEPRAVLTMIRLVALKLLRRGDLGDPDDSGPRAGLDVTDI